MGKFFLFVAFQLLVFGFESSALGLERSLQVEGLVLGQFPKIADGFHVTAGPGLRDYQLEPAQRCLEGTAFEKAGVAFNGLSFMAESRSTVRNKMTGLIGYPGLSEDGEEATWMRSAKGVALDFYRDNLFQAPADNVSQIIFVPMILAPQPLFLTNAEWTPEAKKILETEGFESLKKYCGSHIVLAVGEENYVIYSIRVTFNSGPPERQSEYVSVGERRQSPSLVLDDLYRMRERMEFEEGRSAVTVDILQVGGKMEDVLALRTALVGMDVNFASTDVPDSTVTRATLTCTPKMLERCQKFTQTFLDYQFGRLNFSGNPPTFAPVRFRLAPLEFVKNYVR